MENKRKIMNGFILLNSIECDFEKIKSNLKKDWNIDVSHEKIEKGTLAFDIGENLLALSFIPVPVPNEEAEKNAVNNYLWHNGAEETKKHTAQIIAAVMGDNPYSVGIYFNKLVSSVLKLSNAIGIYKYPTVLSAEEYIEAAGYLNEGELPIANMIYIGLYNSEKGMCGYTEGMEFFGKKEIEVLDTNIDPFDLYNFIYDISFYVLSNDVELKDGETIGFSEEQKLPITISEGVSVEGESIKISYNILEN